MSGQSNRHFSKFGQSRPDGIRQRLKHLAQIVQMGIRVSHLLSRVLCAAKYRQDILNSNLIQEGSDEGVMLALIARASAIAQS